MEPSHTACLDIRLSTALGTLWRNAPLTDEVTQVGRPEAGEPGVNLEYLWVSRKHARIFREGTGEETTYFLENWNGPAGVRLYEKIMRPGERHVLHHGYVFHIPGVLATPTDPYFIITFCMGAKRTSCLSIMFGQPPYISIFGQLVDFPLQEYVLLEYLYMHKDQICLYHDIIAYVWTDKPRPSEKIQEYLERLYADNVEFSNRRKALDTLVAKMRKKIRQASGGVMLIETVHGEGFCLRT
jgi:DNA-binding winged helix-turn-helix (wHTH) protein